MLNHIEIKYSAERGKSAETYQSLEATVKMHDNRHYVTVELGCMQRWRSKEELASYLIWCAEQVLKLPTETAKKKVAKA